MMSTKDDGAWDFSSVFRLLHSLTPASAATDMKDNVAATHTQQPVQHDETSLSDIEDTGLGDFQKLFKYLDAHSGVPLPTNGTFEVGTAAIKTRNQDAYASDGALYYPPSSKGVRWRDEVGTGADLADTQPETPSRVGLSKNQRKKRNRKMRQKEQSRDIEEDMLERFTTKNFESEDDLGTSPPTPARHAGIHKSTGFSAASKLAAKKTVMPTNSTAIPMKSRCPNSDALDSIGESKSSAVRTNKSTATPVARAPTTPQKTAKNYGTPSSTSHNTGKSLWPSQVAPAASAKSATRLARGISGITERPARSAAVSPDDVEIHDFEEWNAGSPSDASDKQTNAQFPRVPAAGQARLAKPVASPAPSAAMMAAVAPATVPAQKTRWDVQPTTQPSMPTRKRYEALPKAFPSNADQYWSLLLKLVNNFPSECEQLLSPLSLSINPPAQGATGLHVFVDASNILIGFHDQLKRVRGIPAYARMPRVDLNFHALALLLERRRGVAKRELVGSNPEIPAFEEARQVGYRVCVLDKVFKAREKSERQKRFEAERAGRANGGHQQQRSGSGSEGPEGAGRAGLPQQAKWVEQCVDELLQLKMMESVVDTDVGEGGGGGGAPTMILATGDAAEAEYSGGFLAMLLRALHKGWRVEVVAWGASISQAYRRLERKGEWGARFRIIQLDDYVEELFGVSTAGS